MKKLVLLLMCMALLSSCSQTALSPDVPILADFIAEQPTSVELRNIPGIESDEVFASVREYLYDSTEEFSISDVDKDIAALDEIYQDAEVFLIGEAHAIAYNYDVQLFFIKYLNQKFGIRHILMECGYPTAMLVNRYLETGDETILDGILKNIQRTSSYTNDFYNFFVKLYEFNQSLSKDKKLVLLGIDIEHQPLTGLNYLRSILPEKGTAPKEIREEADAMISAINVGLGPKVDVIKQYLQNISESSLLYEEYFGESYAEIVFSLENIMQGKNYISQANAKDFYESFELRERYIINNFIKLYNYYGKPKTFGQFGSFHSDIHPIHTDFTLASYLYHDYPATAAKIINARIVYHNSKYIYGDTEMEASESFYDYNFEHINGDFAIINLTRDNSPFLCPDDDMDYYYGAQYNLIIKNSPAAEIYAP